MTRIEIESEANRLSPQERAALALSLWGSLDAEDQQAIRQQQQARLRGDLREGIEALAQGDCATYTDETLADLAAEIKREGRQGPLRS
jgi:hypothetical protein